MQQIEPELWNEFQEELQKIVISPNLQGSKITSKSLREFWEKFLIAEFPTGEINTTLEKNFAVYIYQNQIDVQVIKEKYNQHGWNIGGLLGWLKKVNAGEITSFNLNELLIWSNENGKFEVGLLESAKKEIALSSSFQILRDSELESYEPINQGWLIQNLIGKGKIVILGGKRSTMKTWFSLSAIYSIAHGLKFLGNFETEKTSVLVLDRENGFGEIKKRVQLIKKGLEINEDSNVLFLSESPFKLDDTLNLSFLEEFIISNNIKLVVGDTLRRLISFDEDKANLVSYFLVDILKPLAERTNCSFLLIAHEKKGESSGDDMDMLRGSSDFANFVDGVIQLKRSRNHLTIKQTKNRGAKELEPFNIKIVTDETSFFKFEYLGEKEYKEDIVSKKLTDWIIRNKKKSFIFTEGLKGCGEPKNSYSNALNLLTEQGILTHEGRYYLVSKDLGGEL